MARGNIAKITANDTFDAQIVEFTDGDKIEASMSQFSPEIIQRLASFGLQVKSRNTYAGETDLAVAKAKVTKCIEQLVLGKWAVAREAGAGGNISDLANALSQLTGMTIEACVDKLEDMEKEEKADLRKNAKVAVVLAEMSAERKRVALAKATAKAAEAGEADNESEDVLAGFAS